MEPAVASAQNAFCVAAKQQKKQLMAAGIESDMASIQLMDLLLQHGSGAASSGCQSSQLQQHVVSVTGFTELQAAKTLLLKDEISLLRRQGHGTPALIEQLQKRLRFASSSTADENSSAPVQPQKKFKRNEEGHDQWPPLQDSQPGRGELACEGRLAVKKRLPDDVAPSPPKKLKPQFTRFSSEPGGGAC